MLSSGASGAQLERERLLRLLDSLRLKKRLQVDASCCNGCLFDNHHDIRLIGYKAAKPSNY
jgi:hypothetical protein